MAGMNTIREQIGTRYRLQELVESGRARELRERAQLSCIEIGNRLGVSPGAVTRWELGQRTPRGRLAFRYLRLLDDIDAAIKENGHG